MNITIDVDRLRRDVIEYYGTAMFNASPMAIMELSKAESASDEEIVNMALQAGLDLTDYEV